MNNLEQMKKRKNNISTIIAIIIVLNLLILLAFAGLYEGQVDVSTFDSGIGEEVGPEEPDTTPEQRNANVSSIATGANFTIALDKNGNVWSWGQNSKGQLGNGTMNESVIKSAVYKNATTQLNNVIQISAGNYHAVALTNDADGNKVYVWGYNYFGQSGKDDLARVKYASVIDTTGYNIKQVAAGADYTIALTTDGELLGLGNSNSGQLGFYNDLQFTTLREIDASECEITAISAGYQHVLALDDNGDVWCWGGKSGTSFSLATKTKIEGLSNIVDIKAGNDVSIAVDNVGNVYTWGLTTAVTKKTITDEETNEVNLVVNDGNANVNVHVRGDNSIGVVNQTFFVIDEDSNLYSWGVNTAGQTGTNTPETTENVSTPTIIKTAHDVKGDQVKKINTKIDKVISSAIPGTGKNDTGAELASSNGRYDAAYAINSSGYVLGWGYAGIDIADDTTGKSNTLKLLGDGSKLYADYIGSIKLASNVSDDIILDLKNGPTEKEVITELSNRIIGGRVNLYNNVDNSSTVSIENLDIRVMDEDIAQYNKSRGKVVGYAQGKTVLEAKIDGKCIYINVIVKDNDNEFVKIKSGRDFTVALKADGTIWGWGNNSYVGLSSISLPTQINFNYKIEGEPAKIKDIAVGDYNGFAYILVVAEDGTVWGKGYNGHGQLGNGSSANSSSFTQVVKTNETALSNVVSVSAGAYHALAVTEDGTVWAWGYGNYGQLGNSSVTHTSTKAVQVDLQNVVKTDGTKEEIRQVEAAQNTSYILTKSGNVYAFGYNEHYQYGYYGSSSKIPVRIMKTYPNKILKISSVMYGNFVYALTTEGNVYVLGYNATPMQILQGVVDVEGGYNAYTGIAKFADKRVGYWSSSSIASNNIITNNNVTFLSNTEDKAMLIEAGEQFYTVVRTDGSVWAANQVNGSKYALGNRNISVTANKLNFVGYEYIKLNKYEETINIGEYFDIDAIKKLGFNLYRDSEEIIDIDDLTFEVLKPSTQKNEADGIVTIGGEDGTYVNRITGAKSGRAYVVVTYTDPLGEITKLRVAVNVLDNTNSEKVETTMPDTANGYLHTVALKVDGTVYGWGYNHYGELGSSTVRTIIREPMYLGINGVKDVEAGYQYTLLLYNDGTVGAMGYNNWGELGNNTEFTSYQPVKVLNSAGEPLRNIKKIVALDETSYALDENGNMYAWGYGETQYARRVNTNGLKVIDIAGKLILTEDGSVWEYQNKNSAIICRSELKNIVQISSSTPHSSTSYATYMALDANGKVYEWSRSSIDKILNADSYNIREIPFATVEGTVPHIVDIEAGVNVAYAIDKDGNVYSWGNYYIGNGILGTGAASSSTPNKISELVNIESISATKYSTKYRNAIVVDKLGAVYGFGTNGTHSLLGVGNTEEYYEEPVQIGESYAGFVDELNNEITRISMVKGSEKTVTAILIDSFSLRYAKAATEDTEFTWDVIGDLATISGNSGFTNTITAGDTVGEVTVVAIDSDTGLVAKLFIDVIEPGTKVAPKVETVGDYTVALKADGTVWTWGACESGLGTLDNLGNVAKELSEPKQVEIPNNPTIVDIAVSSNHVLLLAKNGDVYSYGYNGYGKLGRSTRSSSGNLPEKVTSLKNIVKIAAGDTYSFAIDKSGRLYTAGYLTFFINNTQHTPIANQNKFLKVSVFDNEPIKAIIKSAIDITNGYVLGADGKVRALRVSSLSPETGTELEFKIENVDQKVVKISRTSGSKLNGHTAFVTANGNVFTMGKGTNGQLGNNVQMNSYNTPVAVKIGDANTLLGNIRNVYTGENHTIAVAKDGKAYTWGSNDKGQLRNGSGVVAKIRPTANVVVDDKLLTEEDNTLNMVSKVIAVSAGNGYSVAVTEDGYAYAWGNGENYQLGDSLKLSSKVAVNVGGQGIKFDTNHVTLQVGKGPLTVGARSKELNLIYDQNVELESARSTDIDIAQAEVSTDLKSIIITPLVAGTTSVTTSGKIYVQKQNTSIEGNDDSSILQVTILPSEAELNINMPIGKFIQPMTASGKNHTIVLKSDGTVWAFGDNSYGQLGGYGSYTDVPRKVNFPTTTPIIAVASGDKFSVALDANGIVYTWGYNGNGELGIGQTWSYYSTPQQVESINKIVKIAAGANQVLALDEVGKVYTWGKNNNGSLGTGASVNTSVPTVVGNLTEVIDIAVGKDHAMALTEDGRVYTTGNNNVGQLGDTSVKGNRTEFKEVTIPEDIEYISAGNGTSMAIATTGSLYVWGNNANGQLGVGQNKQTVTRPEKVNISGKKVESVSAGDNHSSIVTNDGTLYMTGSNAYGQLGVGTGTSKSNTFVKVGRFENNAIRATAGTNYTTVIDQKGYVYGFGNYNYDIANRKSVTNSFVPIMISEDVAYLNEQEIVVYEGNTAQIHSYGGYRLNVLHKDNSSFDYESVNGNIATVNGEGKVTGVASGTTIIKVTENDLVGDPTDNVCAVIVKVVPKNASSSTPVAPTVDGGEGFTAVTDQNGILSLFGNKANLVNSNIPTVKDSNIHLSTVKAGKDFVVGIGRDDKRVYVLGDNTYGQAGLNSDESYYQNMKAIPKNAINGVVQIDAGNRHVIALDDQKTVYVWGDNSNRQLGMSSVSSLKTPTIVLPENGDRAISVAAGGDYSAIVTSRGNVYILGNSDSMRKVDLPEGVHAIKVAVEDDVTLVLTADGDVYSVSNSTAESNGKIGSNAVDIAANKGTFMYTTVDKKLYTFGDNSNGELGNGSTNYSTQPTQVSGIKNVFSIGAGYNNTYYINTKGEVYAAGTNANGELGNGTSQNSSATTYEGSTIYTKVGSLESQFKPKSVRIGVNWTVRVGDNSLVAENNQKVVEISKKNEFNVFGKKVINLDEYTFEIAEEQIPENEADDIVIEEADDTVAYKVSAIAKGEAKVLATNKITGQTIELPVIVVDDILLRIEDLYVEDSNKAVFDSEPRGQTNFFIDIDGAEPNANGILKINLVYPSDTVLSSDGTVNQNKTTGEVQITGIDLRLPVQDITIRLKNGEEIYTYVVTIYRSAIVAVNNEVLLCVDETNQATGLKDKVYNKFIDPAANTATIKVTVAESTSSVKLYNKDKSKVLAEKTIQDGVEPILMYTPETDVNSANYDPEDLFTDVKNDLILEVTKGTETKEFVIRIQKVSISKVVIGSDIPDTSEYGNYPYTDYVERFTAELEDQPSTRTITLQLKNKNVRSVSATIAQIKQNGTTTEPQIVNTSFVGQLVTLNINLPNEAVSDKAQVVIDVTAEEPETGVRYVEKYVLDITVISSNADIKRVVLNVPEESPIVIEEDTIILHNADIDLVQNLGIDVYPQSMKAKVSIDGENYLPVTNSKVEYTETSLVQLTDNEYVLYVWVKAENGSVKEHEYHIFKESENTKMQGISTISDSRRIDATRRGNKFEGRLIKDSTSYKLEINLKDEYADITSIKANINDENEELEDLVGSILTKVSGTPKTSATEGSNGKYVYTIAADKLEDIYNKEIKIAVQAEYDECTEEYTLVLVETDANASFESIMIDGENLVDRNGNTISIEPLNASGTIATTATISAQAPGKLLAKAESEFAKVQVLDASGKLLKEGTGKVEDVDLNIEIGETKAFTIRVIAEEGTTITKTLTVKRLSDDVEIRSIIAKNGNEVVASATKDTGDATGKLWTMDISEKITNPVIEVTPQNPNATVIIAGIQDDDTVDISDEDAEISITVTSEDRTVTKNYIVKINKLSSNTNIEKEIHTLNGATIKYDNDFQASGNTYTVTLIKDSGYVNLVIKPEDENATVESEDYVVTKDTSNNYYKIKLNTDVPTTVPLKVTAADGTSKNYVININLEESMLTELKVDGNKVDVIGGAAEVRVNPDNETATVSVTVNTTYNPVTVKMSYENGVDISGDPIIETITNTIGEINLNEDETLVTITLEATSKTETIYLNIVKGNKEVGIDSVVFTANDDDTNNVTITEFNTDRVYLINKVDIDHTYNMTINSELKSTSTIYYSNDDLDTSIDSVDLSTWTTITENSEDVLQAILSQQITRFIVVANAEYGDATAMYEFFIREAASDVSLVNFDIEFTYKGNTLTKKLEDFGEFEHNDEFRYDEINILLPSNLDSFTISNLVYDISAVAKWTDITSNPTEYTIYDSEDSENNTKACVTITDGLHMLIKVKAENGAEKIYKVNFAKDLATDLTGRLELLNVDESQEVGITENEITEKPFKNYISDVIAGNVEKVKVTVDDDSATLVVTKVNGKEILALGAPESDEGENFLEFQIKDNFMYYDNGVVTINANEVAEVIVSITVKSNSDKFYEGTAFEGDPTTYELAIRRTVINEGLDITVQREDNTQELIAIEKFIQKANENGKPTYECEYIIGPNEDTLSIVKIEAKNNYSTVSHNGLEAKLLDYTSNLYTISLENVDVAQERIVVKSYLGDEAIYYLSVRRQSTNANIGNIIINETKADPIANEENSYSAIIYLPIEKLDLKVTGVDKNAEVKAQIIKVDSSDVTTTEQVLRGTGTEKTANILQQLVEANVTNPEEILVKITVTAEDGETENTYMLFIEVQDNRTEIAKVEEVLPSENIAINIDKQLSHYMSIGKTKIDDTIYTQYIDPDKIEETVKITTARSFSQIKVSSTGNEYINIGRGSGQKEITLSTTSKRTVLYVQVESEDKTETKNYQIWLIKKATVDEEGIAELKVTELDGERLNIDENNLPQPVYNEAKDCYELDLDDTKNSITLKLSSEYEFADVGLGGQKLEIHQTTLSIDDLQDIEIDSETGKIKIKVIVAIPAEACVRGELINTEKYLYIDIRSDDATLGSIEYYTDKDASLRDPEELELVPEGYEGAYEITLDAKDQKLSLVMSAYHKKATIALKLSNGDVVSERKQTLTVQDIDVSNLQESMELDVIVTSESGIEAKYKLTVKKETILRGRIVTEGTSETEVKIVDSNDNEIATITEEGIFEEKVTGNEVYKVAIDKPGYLAYEMIQIPVEYGEIVDVGTITLIAGDVDKDNVIGLLDLTKVNKVARKNSGSGVRSANADKPYYDFNEDGIINNTDVAILTKNYDKVAQIGENAVLFNSNARPIIKEFTAEYTANGVQLDVSAADDGTISAIEFYRMNKTTNEYELINNARIDNDNASYLDPITLDFNEIAKYKVVVIDSDTIPNKVTQEKEVSNNKIMTKEEFVLLSTRTNKSGQTIVLGADIDLEGITITPFGTSANPFTGTFDGDGHVIKNLNMDSTDNYTSLFGVVKNATIKNLGIESGTINGGFNTGAFIGKAEGTVTIENCYNKAEVNSTKSYVGGFIGETVSGSIITIKNSYNMGDISGDQRVGGFIGQAGTDNVLINNCYNVGNISVTGNNTAGDIIAYALATIKENKVYTAQLDNCYILSSSTNKGVGDHTNVTIGIESERAKLNYTVSTFDDTDSGKANLLNGLSDEFVADSANRNGGYPILKWEASRPAPVAMFSMMSANVEEELVLPISGTYAITSEFGSRIDPITGEEIEFHSGMDIAADWQTPILSVAEGTVTFAGENGGYGYCVEIEHIINGVKLYSFYAHLSKIETDVVVGETVSAGQQIGLEGGIPGDEGAGKSTGAHLHFEIRKSSGLYSSAVNPRTYLEFKK